MSKSDSRGLRGRADPVSATGAQDILNQAVSLHKAGRLSQAERLYGRVLAQDPRNIAALNWLGILAAQLGRHETAAELMRRAIGIEPANPELHMNLGVALRELNRVQEATAAFRRAVRIAPGNARAHDYLGGILLEQGKVDEALAHFRRVLEIDPGHAEAYRKIAGSKRFSEYDSDVSAMERLVAHPETGDEQRMHLSFALGKAYEDLGEYDVAFRWFLEANRLKRRTFAYRVEEDEAFFGRLIAAFGRERFEGHGGAGYTDAAPIFIVGMPRSGSTLVEQVLASHPRVSGLGEIGDLQRLIRAVFPGGAGKSFPEDVARLAHPAFARLGAAYIDGIRRYAPGKQRVADKMLANFKFVGMIRLMLPNARIVHCVRDPADTCLSCFTHYFSGVNPYAYDLEELGRYYRLYERLMAHWHEVLPGRILDVRYESLVADLSGQTRRLLEFCGLPWDDACLAFHETARAVKTASMAQVRRPVYDSSVRRWRRYERHLGPLLTALGQA